MKKLTKKMKSIIIASVSLVCVAAIVLGCVFGLRKKPTPPEQGYELTAGQVALGNDVNDWKEAEKNLTYFSPAWLLDEDGVENATINEVAAVYSYGYSAKVSGTGSKSVFVYETNADEEKFSTSIEEKLEFDEPYTNFAIVDEKENYVAYQYNHASQNENFVTYKVAYISDEGDVSVVNKFSAKVNNDQTLSVNGENYTAYHVIFNKNFYIVHLAVLADDGAIEKDLITFARYTTSEVSNGDVLTLNYDDASKFTSSEIFDYGYIFVRDEVAYVGYLGDAGVVSTSFEIPTAVNYSYTMTSAGLLVEVEQKVKTSEKIATSVFVDQAYYANFSYKFVDIKTGELKNLSLADGYSKMEINQDSTLDSHIHVVEKKVDDDGLLSDKNVKVSFFNNNAVKVLSYDLKDYSNGISPTQIYAMSGNKLLTGEGVVSTKKCLNADYIKNFNENEDEQIIVLTAQDANSDAVLVGDANAYFLSTPEGIKLHDINGNILLNTTYTRVYDYGTYFFASTTTGVEKIEKSTLKVTSLGNLDLVEQIGYSGYGIYIDETQDDKHKVMSTDGTTVVADDVVGYETQVLNNVKVLRVDYADDSFEYLVDSTNLMPNLSTYADVFASKKVSNKSSEPTAKTYGSYYEGEAYLGWGLYTYLKMSFGTYTSWFQTKYEYFEWTLTGGFNEHYDWSVTSTNLDGNGYDFEIISYPYDDAHMGYSYYFNSANDANAAGSVNSSSTAQYAYNYFRVNRLYESNEIYQGSYSGTHATDYVIFYYPQNAKYGSKSTAAAWNPIGATCNYVVQNGSNYSIQPGVFDSVEYDHDNFINGNSYYYYDQYYEDSAFLQYTPNKCTISYVLNGGDMGGAYNPDGEEEYVGTDSWIRQPTRTGYTFMGWTFEGMDTTYTHYFSWDGYTSDDNTSGMNTTSASISIVANPDAEYLYYKNLRYDDGQTVTITCNWQANDYTVEYYATNVRDTAIANTYASYTSQKTDTITFDTNYTIVDGTAYDVEGYSVIGWVQDTSTGTIVYNNGQAVNPWQVAENIKLYAKYAKNMYNISYELNGGTHGSSHPDSAEYDQTITISNPTKLGYTFTGWTVSNATATISDNKATSFTGLRTDDYGQTVTFTANWQAHSYTIEYNLSDGSTRVDPAHGTYHPTSVNYDQEFTVSAPTMTGRTFAGWNISGMDSNSHVVGGSASSSTTASAITGTTFKNLHATNGAKVTFTATWTQHTYSITYDLKSGTHGSSHPDSATFDQMITVSAPTRTGYTFGGWTVSGMGSTHLKYYGSTVPYVMSIAAATTSNKFAASICLFDCLNATNGSTVTFTANWTANTYKIEYDLNDVSSTQNPSHGTNHPTTATYDSEFTINNPTMTGYTFTGWSISGMDSNSHTVGGSASSSTTASSVKGTSFNNLHATKDATVKFKATWTAISYKISYTMNSGTHGSSHPTTVYYDTAFTVNNPTKFGYTFTGWNISGMNTCAHTVGGTSSSSTTANYVTGTSFNNLTTVSGATITFEATFTINTYKISYTLNGGSYGTYHPNDADYNEVIQISNPTKRGYTFLGWAVTGMSTTCSHYYGTSSSPSSSLTSSTTSYTFGTTYVYFKNLHSEVNATVTFTATWKANTYTVNYFTSYQNAYDKVNKLGAYSAYKDAANVVFDSGLELLALNNTSSEKTIPNGYEFVGWYFYISQATSSSTTVMSEIKNSSLKIEDENCYTGTYVPVALAYTEISVMKYPGLHS